MIDMVNIRDIGGILIRIGGIIILIIALLDLIKYIVYLLAINIVTSLFYGFIGKYLTIYKGLFDWIVVLGYSVLIFIIAINIIIFYIGYKLYKIGGIGITKEIRDKWIIIIAIFLALSLFMGSTLSSISFLLPLIGLIIFPIEGSKSIVGDKYE